jgi:hypothetical protein
MPMTAARPKRTPKKAAHHVSLGTRLNRLWARRGVRIAAWTIAALVWIPFLLVLSVVIGINPIFNRGVEKLGEDALHVPVRLKRASVSFAGRLSLGRFTIANPPGFREIEAVSFDGLYAEVPLRSVFRQDIDIPVLTVVHPVFNLELGDKDKPSNWGVLMKNLSHSLPKKDEPEPPDGQKRFKIGALKIVDPVILYRSSTFPDGILLDLKDVELKKVGNTPDSSSKTYVVLASIFQAILTGGIKDKNLPKDVTGSLTEELSHAAKDFGDVLKGIK